VKGSTQILELKAVLSGESGQLWLQDRQAMDRAGCSSLLSVPQGAQCLMAHRVATGSDAGLLVVFSERPRWGTQYVEGATDTMF
jgi:hypothetical protein